MSATIWRCECGAKYEIPEAGLGRRVRCSHCGAVSRVEKPPSINAPPPLPKASVPRSEGSDKRPIAQGHSVAAVSSESKKPKLSPPVIWAALIFGSASLSVLLLLSVLVLSVGSTPQPSVATKESALAKQLRELKEEALAAEDMARRRDAQAQQPPADIQSDLSTGKVLELADLAELVGPSVVQVNVTKPKKSGTGSGFVLDKQGTIVTNYHVIEDATAGTIVFSDRTSAPITGYLGVWPEKDIALVKVECPPDKLHAIRLATSAPRQGERVAAFGSPLGLQQSVSEGIVSAVRESEELRTLFQIDIDALLIQTTTPISPGNSGGPLVDMKGMVVGVNTMGLQILGGENLNFAVAMAELPPFLLARSEIASPLPFRDPTVNEVERIVKRAKDHRDAGDSDSAIADFTEAIRLDPKNARAYLLRGMVYDVKGDHDSAIADYTEAIRLDPKNARADVYYFLRAVVYSRKGDSDSAIADYTEAIRLDPKNAEAYLYRGMAYRNKGVDESAIADFKEVIRLDPAHVGARQSLGFTYQAREDYFSAIAEFAYAIRLNPTNSLNHFERGQCYRETADYDRAIADYTEAIRLNPKYAAAFTSRGYAYRAKRDYDRAIADYTEAIRLNPVDASAFEGRGSTHLEKGDYDSAIADYTKAIRLNPVDASAFFGRGRVYRIKGDYDSSIADYTKAIRIDPKKSSSFRLRGEAYGEKGDYDRAIADYDEAIRLNPTPTNLTSKMEYIFSYHGRGESYRRKRDYNSAIADFTEAIRLSSDSASNLTSRGDAYREKGDYDRAIADYTEVIRSDTKNAKAYWGRGKTYELKGQKTIAKRDFEQATKLGYNPSDSKTAKRNPGKNDSKVAEKEAFPERSKVRDRWKKIVIGMPYPQVEKLLGRPNDVRTYGSVGAHWTYRFDWTPFDGLVSFDGNGIVTGWSEPLDWKLNE